MTPMDLSTLSNEELKALASGDMSALSGATLTMLAKPPSIPAQVAPASPQVPEWAKKYPELYGVAGAVRETLGPLVSAGGGLIGSLLGGTAGAVGGPAGVVAGGMGGAGLGYGIGNEINRLADVALGNVTQGTPNQITRNALSDIATGATLEGGGQIAGNLLGRGVKAIMATSPKAKAAAIARNAAGAQLPALQTELANAPAGLTAAQAMAPVYSPTTQAVTSAGASRLPAVLTGKGAPGVTEAQSLEAQRVLAEMSGGATATEARGVTDAARKGLSTTLFGGVGKPILERAGVGNEVIPGLEAVAVGFPQAASKEFGNLREMQSSIKLGQLPASAAREAVDRAGGLTDAALHAQQTLQQLETAGLRPVNVDSLLRKIEVVTKDPQFAGLSEMQTALNLVVKEIKRWTTADGLINPLALDSIRKNAVNSTVQKLLGNAAPSVQQQLAGKLTASLRPAIVDAVEQAGGTGYGAYLEKYSGELQNIAKQKLVAEAMRLYKDSPSQFVKLVQGESPDVVEGFLGPGNYNLGQELAQDALTKLKGIADITQRGASAVEQAGKGQKAYADLLESNIGRIKLPWGLSPKGAAVNKGLDILEQKVGKKVMRELAEASVSADSYAALLRRMPPESSALVDRVMRTTNWGANALANPQENKNQLSK